MSLEELVSEIKDERNSRGLEFFVAYLKGAYPKIAQELMIELIHQLKDSEDDAPRKRKT